MPVTSRAKVSDSPSSRMEKRTPSAGIQSKPAVTTVPCEIDSRWRARIAKAASGRIARTHAAAWPSHRTSSGARTAPAKGSRRASIVRPVPVTVSATFLPGWCRIGGAIMRFRNVENKSRQRSCSQMKAQAAPTASAALSRSGRRPSVAHTPADLEQSPPWLKAMRSGACRIPVTHHHIPDTELPCHRDTSDAVCLAIACAAALFAAQPCLYPCLHHRRTPWKPHTS